MPGPQTFPKKFTCALVVMALLMTCYNRLSAQNTILWRVTDSVSQHTSFILGTFHQMGNSFVDSLPVIKSSLYECDVAIFESIDPIEETRARIMRRPASSAIEKSLGKKYYSKMKELSRDWEVDIHRLKPVELRWKLQQEYQKTVCGTVKPGDTWDHFDSYLIHLANNEGMTVLGLETDSAQLALIDKEYNSPQWNQERKIIKRWINFFNDPTPDPRLCGLSVNYRQLNLDYAFERPCNDDVLLNERNQEWMKILPEFIRTNRCFIAVGYFHLRNECGLLKALEKRGFVVEPVTVDNTN